MDEYVDILMNTYNNSLIISKKYNNITERSKLSFSEFIEYPNRFFILKTSDMKDCYSSQEMIVYKINNKFILIDFIYEIWNITLCSILQCKISEDSVYNAIKENKTMYDQLSQKYQYLAIKDLIQEIIRVFDTIEELIEFIKEDHLDHNRIKELIDFKWLQ